MAEEPVEIEDDELFPDDEEPDVDEILDASDAAIEDLDADDDIELAVADLPPLGRTWLFDFQEGEFVAEGRSPKTIRGDAAIQAWVEKCLRTAQGDSLVHPPEYGLAQPLGDYLGTVSDEDDLAGLESDIEEAVSYHPHIQTIEGFEVRFGDTVEGDAAVNISFEVILVDGSEVPFEAELEVEAAV